MTNANVVTWSGRSLITTRLNASNVAGSGTPLNIGWGVSSTVTDSAFPDVNMFQPSTTDPRVAGTVSFLQANQLADTFQVVGTITANGAKAVTEVALFDTASAYSPQTNIAATINATYTTLSLFGAGAAGMPTAGNYYAQLENEVVLVTAGQGSNSLTISRAQLGSTAASHSGGAWIVAGGDGGAHSANTSTSSETWGPTGANGGSMFVHADFPVINLNNGDSIQFTLKVQLQ
jgi:hypothetical protein